MYISKEKLDMTKWRNGQFIDSSSPFVCNTALLHEMQSLRTPFQFFRYFFSQDIIKKIVFETNQYSMQENQGLMVDNTDILRYLGILIFTSIVRLLNVRNYW